MKKNVVILGGGTAGTVAANRLRRTVGADVAITVVDRDAAHIYQPGLLFVPFGLQDPERLVRPRRRQLRAGIDYREVGIDHVGTDESRVYLKDGAVLGYDVLVVASGARLLPDETPGLTGRRWMQDVFTFYDLAGAAALADALPRFGGGDLVVDVVDMPIKCPVAPLEFCFLADWFFRRQGRRDDVRIRYVTPLDAAFTKQIAARALSGLLEAKGIELVTEFNTGELDVDAGELVSFDDRRVRFDLAVTIPVHGGAEYVGRSPGLGDEFDFVPADPNTLQAKAAPNVFVIGDAAAIAVSKAGSVAHFEGEILAGNVARYLAGEKLDRNFDGHTNCFIETGHGKALLIDFNYETEPLPGRYPAPVGLPLLKQSRLNHLGKLMFEPMYWNAILPGRDIPGVAGPMPFRGKDLRRSIGK